MNFYDTGTELDLFMFQESRKGRKDDSSLLRMFNEHEVTRRSLTPFLLGSPKRIKSDCSRDSKQKVYQEIRKTTYTPWQSYENQGLSVLQSIFPNAVFGALRFTRRQTRLPMDKGCKPNGVSPYICDGTWEPNPY